MQYASVAWHNIQGSTYIFGPVSQSNAQGGSNVLNNCLATIITQKNQVRGEREKRKKKTMIWQEATCV